MKRQIFRWNCSLRQNRKCACHSSTLIAPIPQGRPDLHLYSQTEFINKNEVPSWINPDIDTGALLTAHEDKPYLTLDRVIVRITNRSTLAPAFNALIHCEVSEYGIGLPRTRLESKQVTINPSQTKSLEFQLSMPRSESDPIGAFIRAELPSDINPIDNEGAQVSFGTYSYQNDDKTVNFDVGNPTDQDGDISLTLHTNRLDALIEPAVFTLESGHRMPVKLSYNLDNIDRNAGGREDITVIARLNGVVIGGLTYYVRIYD